MRISVECFQSGNGWRKKSFIHVSFFTSFFGIMIKNYYSGQIQEDWSVNKTFYNRPSPDILHSSLVFQPNFLRRVWHNPYKLIGLSDISVNDVFEINGVFAFMHYFFILINFTFSATSPDVKLKGSIHNTHFKLYSSYFTPKKI